MEILFLSKLTICMLSSWKLDQNISKALKVLRQIKKSKEVNMLKVRS